MTLQKSKKCSFSAAFMWCCLIFMNCGKAGTNISDCEKGNKSVPCTERTDDENARTALDNGDLATAVTLLERGVAAEPDNYQRFSLLAAAYAGLGGFNIFNIIKAQTSAGGSIFDIMHQFLPDPLKMSSSDYKSSLSYMKKSVDLLTSIPAAKRERTSGEKYANSATFQLTLYQSAYSIMYLNQFAYSVNVGSTVDFTKLETMSDADAEAILNNLAAAAAVQQGEQGQAVSIAVGKAQSEIMATEGATTKEKLINYMHAKNPSSETPSP